MPHNTLDLNVNKAVWFESCKGATDNFASVDSKSPQSGKPTQSLTEFTAADMHQY